MSILYNILGKPGRDNALFVKINSGKRFYRLLFDCGEMTLNSLDQGDIKAIDYIFFSHCHIDHIAGFDYLFRRLYDREKAVVVFGPPGITKIIFNRLNGFTWNIPGMNVVWIVNEVNNEKIITSSMNASEAFSEIHKIEEIDYNEIILSNQDFDVKLFFLNHIIPVAGYFVREKETYNIDKDRLADLGITSGVWLQKVKDETTNDDEIIYTGGRSYSVLYLRQLLLRKKEGESIAYMTDFIYDNCVKDSVKIINKCSTLICESQYLDEDEDLARQNYHITGKQAGIIAAAADAGKLILFHLSERYKGDDFFKMLDEARIKFPKTFYPSEWKI